MEVAVPMGSGIQSFLRQKGSVGLLSVLNERGKSFSEIEAEVAITSDTISKRKDEAIEIGLIELKPADREAGIINEYHLTDMGEALVRQMAVEGIVSNYRSMRTHQQKVEQKTEELIDWVEENPSQLLEFTEAYEETLIDRAGDDEAQDSAESDADADASGSDSALDDESDDGSSVPSMVFVESDEQQEDGRE